MMRIVNTFARNILHCHSPFLQFVVHSFFLGCSGETFISNPKISGQVEQIIEMILSLCIFMHLNQISIGNNEHLISNLGV